MTLQMIAELPPSTPLPSPHREMLPLTVYDHFQCQKTAISRITEARGINEPINEYLFSVQLFLFIITMKSFLYNRGHFVSSQIVDEIIRGFYNKCNDEKNS